MLELTIISPYLKTDFEVQLSTSTNADECFPNYSKTEKTNRKRRVPERGNAEVGADVMSKNRDFMEHGQPRPRVWVDCNPTSQLALTPVRGLRIWARTTHHPHCQLIRDQIFNDISLFTLLLSKFFYVMLKEYMQILPNGHTLTVPRRLYFPALQ